jgi:hypothetical protein
MGDDGGDMSRSINHDLRLLGEPGDPESRATATIDHGSGSGSTAAAPIALVVGESGMAKAQKLLPRLVRAPATARGVTPQRYTIKNGKRVRTGGSTLFLSRVFSRGVSFYIERFLTRQSLHKQLF